MPLLIEGGRIPTRWLEKKGSRSVAPVSDYLSAMNAVKIALVNNMPDPALEDTELQFFELLEAASGDLPIFVKLCSLPAVPHRPCATPFEELLFWPRRSLE